MERDERVNDLVTLWIHHACTFVLFIVYTSDINECGNPCITQNHITFIVPCRFDQVHHHPIVVILTTNHVE